MGTVSPAPWHAVSESEQLFVLITGASSGVGLGIAQRLIDEFLATRSSESHLILITTTRSALKCTNGVRDLRTYVDSAVRRSTVSGHHPPQKLSKEANASRVHIYSVVLDLCNLRNVYALAKRLCSPEIDDTAVWDDSLGNRRIPRLDSIILNAASGGWCGIDYARAASTLWNKGLIEFATRATYKIALPPRILNGVSKYDYPDEPILSEIFTACLFGHWILAHQLLPLLTRDTTQALPPARIIWSSSLEATPEVFNLSDLQGHGHSLEYESSKRLMDFLSLTSSLPSVKPIETLWMRQNNTAEIATAAESIPPKMYLTHPGLVLSRIFPTSWLTDCFKTLLWLLCRWLGSPWHTVTGYNGAKAATWVALEDQATLDSLNAERSKWGSCVDRRHQGYVKRTEVEGWGWEGASDDARSIATDPEPQILCNAVGRRPGAIDATNNDIAAFERLGVLCWEEMESLRRAWASALGAGS